MLRNEGHYEMNEKMRFYVYEEAYSCHDKVFIIVTISSLISLEINIFIIYRI
jgi:hypothetical protein